jgi:primosomal protein N' (replication factor Y)
LTYFSQQILRLGSIVSVPLKTAVKEAVVIEEVKKPEFETVEIVSVSDKVYSTEQMEIAKFISEYYFSSFGEAISLFIPYLVGVDPCVDPQNEIKAEIFSSCKGRTQGSDKS